MLIRGSKTLRQTFPELKTKAEKMERVRLLMSMLEIVQEEWRLAMPPMVISVTGAPENTLVCGNDTAPLAETARAGVASFPRARNLDQRRCFSTSDKGVLGGCPTGAPGGLAGRAPGAADMA